MNSRLEKYENQEITSSRTKRNQSLYRAMSEEEIENFDVESNTTILDANSNTIDVTKLRDMLDKKYRTPERRSTIEKLEPLEDYKMNLLETREYDVNEILNKVNASKESDYEVDRLKKLRNTNLDILNELSIEKEETQSVPKQESEKLKELIDTINLKEAEGYEKIETTQNDLYKDPLDILSDLKGDNDATKILGAKELQDEITKEAPKVAGLDTVVINELNKQESNELDSKTEELEKTKENTQSLTNSNMFTQSDFDDFNDLKEEVASTKIIIKILIFLVIAVVITGIVFVLNKYLNLGLF